MAELLKFQKSMKTHTRLYPPHAYTIGMQLASRFEAIKDRFDAFQRFILPTTPEKRCHHDINDRLDAFMISVRRVHVW